MALRTYIPVGVTYSAEKIEGGFPRHFFGVYTYLLVLAQNVALRTYRFVLRIYSAEKTEGGFQDTYLAFLRTGWCYVQRRKIGNRRGFPTTIWRFYVPVGVSVLKHPLVVLGKSGNVDDGRDVVEAVDPLLALVALPPHVVHLEGRTVDAVLVYHDPWQNTKIRKKMSGNVQ